MSEEYNHSKIEKKWQKKWEETGLYHADIDKSKPKFYALTMLPYPSGNLHIGHWYAMTPSDARARYHGYAGLSMSCSPWALMLLVSLLKTQPSKTTSIPKNGPIQTSIICAINSKLWEPCSTGAVKRSPQMNPTINGPNGSSINSTNTA